jgi:hypothetical protein
MGGAPAAIAGAAAIEEAPKEEKKEEEKEESDEDMVRLSISFLGFSPGLLIRRLYRASVCSTDVSHFLPFGPPHCYSRALLHCIIYNMP